MQSEIFGYENVTYYCILQKTPLDYPVVTKKLNFCKECQESILSKFWQIAGSQCTEWIQASFEW